MYRYNNLSTSSRPESTTANYNYIISSCALAKIRQVCNFCEDIPRVTLADYFKNPNTAACKLFLKIMNRHGCCFAEDSITGKKTFYLRAENGCLVEAQKIIYGMTYKPIDASEFIDGIEADKILLFGKAIYELANLPNDSEVAENIKTNAERILKNGFSG